MEDRVHAQLGTPAEAAMKGRSRARLTSWLRNWATALLIVLAVFSTPALAHKGEKHGGAKQAQH